MSAETAQASDEHVATPSPDAGKEVWCENGCGNRILDPDEHIPFPCPTGCGGMMTEAKPEPLGGGKTTEVKLPSVGRIVHVLCAPGVIRPAIVMGRESDGRCFVHVFKDDRDPSPPGLATGDGVVSYGTHLGGWFWPARESGVTFEALIVEDD